MKDWKIVMYGGIRKKKVFVKIKDKQKDYNKFR